MNMIINDGVYVEKDIDVEMINVLIFTRIMETWDAI